VPFYQLGPRGGVTGDRLLREHVLPRLEGQTDDARLRQDGQAYNDGGYIFASEKGGESLALLGWGVVVGLGRCLGGLGRESGG